MRERRKQYFLNGNGGITKQFDKMEGVQSTLYQATFKGLPSKLKTVYSPSRAIESNVLTIVPDP